MSLCPRLLPRLAFSKLRHLAGMSIPPIPWPMTLSPTTEVNEVAAESGSDAVGVILFCANGRDKLDVTDTFESVLRDFILVDEEYGVRAINSSAHTLC